jgi:signal peptidase I
VIEGCELPHLASHPDHLSVMQKATLTFLGFIAVVLVWSMWFRPVSLGGSASYATVAGVSMEPRLHTGDLVIAHSERAYQVGDVVVFRIPAGFPEEGSLVVHRIVAGDASGFVVQGDNKESPDPWRPTASDIVGSSWIELPGVGTVLVMLRTPVLLAGTLAVLAALWVFSYGSSRSTENGRASLNGGSPAPTSVEHER